MAPPDSALLYKVAYDEAVRALAEQQAIAESLRNRAGLLLSAAAVTTSFLGAKALEVGAPSLKAWLALAGFVGVALISLAILWPRSWEFGADSQAVISAHLGADEPPPVEDLYRSLSLAMHRSYLKNRDGVNRIAVYFQVAVCLLTIELILWVLAIASPL